MVPLSTEWAGDGSRSGKAVGTVQPVGPTQVKMSCADRTAQGPEPVEEEGEQGRSPTDLRVLSRPWKGGSGSRSRRGRCRKKGR